MLAQEEAGGGPGAARARIGVVAVAAGEGHGAAVGVLLRLSRALLPPPSVSSVVTPQPVGL